MVLCPSCCIHAVFLSSAACSISYLPSSTKKLEEMVTKCFYKQSPERDSEECFWSHIAFRKNHKTAENNQLLLDSTEERNAFSGKFLATLIYLIVVSVGTKVTLAKHFARESGSCLRHNTRNIGLIN